MHIAIDDTYGPNTETKSRFVTGNRRTHVAVVFPDNHTEEIRSQITGCLNVLNGSMSLNANEFHFVDIYNRKPPWDKLPDEFNLNLFDFFAKIYRTYRWPVLIQTVDERTLKDHNIHALTGKIDGLDLSNKSDLSLAVLLWKIKRKYSEKPEPITLFIDEGLKASGTKFSSTPFKDWPKPFQGTFASSRNEPLLQLADFIAFCINRSTHLEMKEKRTEIDNWFLTLVGSMQIDCDDLRPVFHAKPAEDFTIDDFDLIHELDRKSKGL